MTHKLYHLKYPGDTWLLDDKIETLFCEALEANDIGADDVEAWTTDAMAEALEDAGFISLHRNQDNEPETKEQPNV